MPRSTQFESFHQMLHSQEFIIPHDSALLRVYIEPYNREQTIAVLEKMGVRKYRDFLFVIEHVLLHLKSASHKPFETQNRYHLGSRHLGSLVDFALSKTTRNELYHGRGALIDSSAMLGAFLLSYLLTDPHWKDLLSKTTVIMGVFTTLEIYCILVQRYTRARLAQTIDSMLHRNRV